MTFLLPSADGVADEVAKRLPQATILRYEDSDRSGLGDVEFYCLPYMGDGESVGLIAQMPRLRALVGDLGRIAPRGPLRPLW